MKLAGYTPREYLKAIVGCITAGLTALAAVLGDGVTGGEWIGVGIVVVTTFGSVFGTPNGDETEPDDPTFFDEIDTTGKHRGEPS